MVRRRPIPLAGLLNADDQGAESTLAVTVHQYRADTWLRMSIAAQNVACQRNIVLSLYG